MQICEWPARATVGLPRPSGQCATGFRPRPPFDLAVLAFATICAIMRVTLHRGTELSSDASTRTLRPRAFGAANS